MTAAAVNQHHQQQTHHHHHHSSSRSLHSQVQDAVSITRDRIHDVVSHISKQPPVGDTMPSTRGVNGSSNNNNNVNGLKDGWDALVKIMFAPCVNIGGVPREEMEGATTDTYTPSRRGQYSSSANGRGVTASAGANGNNNGWGASVPFEVSASSLLGQSLVMSSSSLDKTSTELHHHQQQQQQHQTNFHPSTPPQQKKQQLQLQDPPGVPGVNNTTVPHHSTASFSNSSWEQRKAQSRAKLRQLGARHQLASGIPGESLADTARPITPGEDDNAAAPAAAALFPPTSSSSSSSQQQPELVDFDDGISAISSHTLEEMERRREQHQSQQHQSKKKAATTTVLRLHPLDFSQIIDEDCEWNDDQVVAGHAATSTENLRREYHHQGGGEGGLDVVEEVDETEVVFGTPFYEETTKATTIPMTSPSDLHRVPSTRTHQTLNTTVTEDTHEFEDMCQRHEALYWTNQDQVASSERKSVSLRGVPHQQPQHHQDRHRSSTSSSSGRMSIEERARRLRELSRSRSRSDGSGSSNKSGTSSLISGQHPHDTIPLYPFDLFPSSSSGRKSNSSSSKSGSGSGSRSRRENYYGSSSGRGRSNRVMNNNGSDAISMMEGSDPFDLLECSEI